FAEIVGRKVIIGRLVESAAGLVRKDAVEQLEIEIVVVEIEVAAAIEIEFVTRVAEILEANARGEDAEIEIPRADPMQSALQGRLPVRRARAVEAVIARPVDIGIDAPPRVGARRARGEQQENENPREPSQARCHSKIRVRR